MDRLKRFKYDSCRRLFFFLKIEKKIPIFENIRIRVDRVSGSKSVVSPQLMVLNSGSRYMISRYSVEEHKDSSLSVA